MGWGAFLKFSDDAHLCNNSMTLVRIGFGRVSNNLRPLSKGYLRATYKRLFPKYSPSQTAKLAMDEEPEEVQRILGEIGTLEATHSLRVQYATKLSQAQADVDAARAQLAAAEVALKLERSQMQRCKVDLDKLRLETHGKLLALLTDKSEADSFYRPTTRAPEEAMENRGMNENAPVQDGRIARAYCSKGIETLDYSIVAFV